MTKEKMKKQDLLMTFLFAMMVLIIILLVIISLSKVKVEGNCKIDKLSFDINETNNIENLSLSKGEIDCSFEIETPIWIVLISR